MSNFPTLSIGLDASTFQETSENTAVSGGDTEGGYVYTRARHTRRPRRSFMFSFTDISDNDKSTLQTFWDDRQGGSGAFNWTHPVSSTVYNVRFDIEMELEFERAGYGNNHRWNSSTITLKEV